MHSGLRFRLLIQLPRVVWTFVNTQTIASDTPLEGGEGANETEKVRAPQSVPGLRKAF